MESESLKSYRLKLQKEKFPCSSLNSLQYKAITEEFLFFNLQIISKAVSFCILRQPLFQKLVNSKLFNYFPDEVCERLQQFATFHFHATAAILHSIFHDNQVLNYYRLKSELRYPFSHCHTTAA